MWTEWRCASRLLLADKISLIFLRSVAIGRRCIWFLFCQVHGWTQCNKSKTICFPSVLWQFVLEWQCSQIGLWEKTENVFNYNFSIGTQGLLHLNTVLRTAKLCCVCMCSKEILVQNKERFKCINMTIMLDPMCFYFHRKNGAAAMVHMLNNQSSNQCNILSPLNGALPCGHTATSVRLAKPLYTFYLVKYRELFRVQFTHHMQTLWFILQCNSWYCEFLVQSQKSCPACKLAFQEPFGDWVYHQIT